MINDEATTHSDQQHDSRGNGARKTFVGRELELSRLRAALVDVLASRGSLLLLGGEPGIGKTRTLQEFGLDARRSGAEVLWSRCYEGQGAPLYWPWVQIIRAAMRNRSPDQLQADMGAGAADIAEIIPEVGETLPHLQLPPPLEPEQARFRLFDSITRFLQRTSESRPLVLLLDNLHAADRSSLLLLEFLASELVDSHLLVVGTYRNITLSRRHPFSNTLAELTRVPHCQWTVLHGLSWHDVRHFIRHTTGVEPLQRFVDNLHARTEGNPLFLTEMLRLLLQSGELTPERMERAQQQHFRIPEGVLAVIGKRLDMLSKDCVHILQFGAVIGREFDLMQLALCTPEVSESQAADLLLEAVASRLIEEVPNAIGRYHFTHALIQETLLTEIPSLQRATLHASFAEALETHHGERADPVQLAYHFAQAAAVKGPEKLVSYALLAGEQALDAYAWEEAQEYFQGGLHARGIALDSRKPAPDAQVAALLFGLGRTQIATVDRLQLQEAIDNLHRAFTYYEQAGDVTQAVAIAAYPYFFSAGLSTGMAQLIARTLSLVLPNSAQAGQILSRYGYVLGLEEGKHQEAQEAFNGALTIADRLLDTGLELRTRAEAARVDRYQRRFQESLKQSLRAIELAQSVDDLHTEVAVRYEASLSLEALGNPRAARQHATAMLALAERLRDRSWLCTALYQITSLSYAQGDWRTVRECSDRGLSLSPRDYRLLSRRSLLEYELGHGAQGDAYLERLLEVMRLNRPGPGAPYMYPAFVIPAVAYLTGDTSRLEIAEESARMILASSSVTQVIAIFARAGLGLLAVQRHDALGAREQYTALAPERHTMLPGSLGAIDRLLGLLAQTMGDVDTAVEHFEAALTFCRRAAYRPELGWTCYGYAAVLLHRNGPGDLEHAMTLVDETDSIAAELAMRSLQERVAVLQATGDAHTVKTPGYPDRLTGREVDVLRLVATGKSNVEVGSALCISLNTVKRHLANIFGKTGAANRAEAATYAAQHNLIEPG